MRTMLSGAAAMAIGLVMMLFSSTAGAAVMCVRGDVPQGRVLPASSQLFDQMEGMYMLSNGQRIRVENRGQGLAVDFGRQHQISLDRVGETAFVSRDGTVNLNYRPDSEQIFVRYTADDRGRYVRAC